MPDETIVTPAQPVAAEPTPEPTARQAVINKYEQMYADQTQSQPAAVVQPITSVEPVQPVAPAAPDMTAVLSALTAEITAMKSQLAEARNPPPPPPSPVDPNNANWLKLLADGKMSEGEKALAEVLGPQIQQQAVQQALSLMQAERDVNEFTAQVKAANPDLMAFESYISLGAEKRIAAAQAANAIKSPVDYVTVYKEAVKAEIENARKLAFSLRGEGRTAAATRIAEVVASPVLQPQPVNTNREQINQQPAQDKSPEQITTDYFAERKARQARNAGMAVA